MTDLSKISIVILNWNGKSFLEQFLPSLISYSGNARIIVADNSSTDDSVAFLKENYSQIEIVVNKENGGFAKGYNDALKSIDSPYYLLLNSDIEVSPDWLLPLYELMESDKQIAGCQPKIKSFYNKEKFEHAGAAGGFLDINYYPFCRGRIFTQVEEDRGQYDYPTEIFWATGAALLIRSEIFHEVEGFDESFFAHMEEIDLCWRIKRRSYSFYVCPESVVYHVGGGTLSYQSPKKTFLNFRNNLFMLVKNHEGWLCPKLFYRMILDASAGVRFVFNGEFKNILMIFKGHIAIYSNLNRLLKERKKIKASEINPNLKGLYKGNILWAHFVKKVKKFSDLNHRLFVK